MLFGIGGQPEADAGLRVGPDQIPEPEHDIDPEFAGRIPEARSGRNFDGLAVDRESVVRHERSTGLGPKRSRMLTGPGSLATSRR